MSYTDATLDQVRRAIAPEDQTLDAARSRRDAALKSAAQIGGVLRSYYSGSIAHGTANHGLDADCGIVLDRRTWAHLGPDGDGPADTVEQVRTIIREILKGDFPDLATRLTKRAIKLTFNEPLSNGLDPTVDLIVGLNRDGGSLWIPNLEAQRWDPSDPIKHTELLTAEPASLRIHRARVIRLAKAWNEQFSVPGMCSFNIEALALEAIVTSSGGIGDGLYVLFEHSAKELAHHLTQDPAGISGAIKLNVDREVMVKRLQGARDLLDRALDDDEDAGAVREVLAELYWQHVDPPAGSESKAAIVAKLARGNSGVRMTSTLTTAAGVGVGLREARSYGCHD